MNPRSAIGALSIVVGIVIMIFWGIPNLGLTSAPTQSFYYTCTVTSQNQINVSGCYVNLVGPEPDGSYIAVVGLDFNSLLCNLPIWSPTVTWTWWNGVVNKTDMAQLRIFKLPTLISATWAIQSTPGAATGSLVIFPFSGTNTFNNVHLQPWPTCPTLTGSATALVSTTSTNPVGSTTATPPKHPVNPIPIGVSGAFLIIGLFLLIPRKRA